MNQFKLKESWEVAKKNNHRSKKIMKIKFQPIKCRKKEKEKKNDLSQLK
jgi:hypothetical protein